MRIIDEMNEADYGSWELELILKKYFYEKWEVNTEETNNKRFISTIYIEHQGHEFSVRLLWTPQTPLSLREAELYFRIEAELYKLK